MQEANQSAEQRTAGLLARRWSFIMRMHLRRILPHRPIWPARTLRNTGALSENRPTKVFDKQQVMAENPNLVVTENKASGSDPVSFAASTYLTVRSKTSTLGFRNALKIFKGQHGHHPTYDELTRMMKQTRLTAFMPMTLKTARLSSSKTKPHASRNSDNRAWRMIRHAKCAIPHWRLSEAGLSPRVNASAGLCQLLETCETICNTSR